WTSCLPWCEARAVTGTPTPGRRRALPLRPACRPFLSRRKHYELITLSRRSPPAYPGEQGHYGGQRMRYLSRHARRHGRIWWPVPDSELVLHRNLLRGPECYAWVLVLAVLAWRVAAGPAELAGETAACGFLFFLVSAEAIRAQLSTVLGVTAR